MRHYTFLCVCHRGYKVTGHQYWSASIACTKVFKDNLYLSGPSKTWACKHFWGYHTLLKSVILQQVVKFQLNNFVQSELNYLSFRYSELYYLPNCIIQALIVSLLLLSTSLWVALRRSILRLLLEGSPL